MIPNKTYFPHFRHKNFSEKEDITTIMCLVKPNFMQNIRKKSCVNPEKKVLQTDRDMDTLTELGF